MIDKRLTRNLHTVICPLNVRQAAGQGFARVLALLVAVEMKAGNEQSQLVCREAGANPQKNCF